MSPIKNEPTDSSYVEKKLKKTRVVLYVLYNKYKLDGNTVSIQYLNENFPCIYGLSLCTDGSRQKSKGKERKGGKKDLKCKGRTFFKTENLRE